MKIKSFILLLLLAITTVAMADDVIVLLDGSLINVKVLEITTTEIKYKKASNPNGPTYTIEKSTVLAINYDNGEKDTFSNNAKLHKSQQSQQNKQEIVNEIEPVAGNSERIAWYNTRNYTVKKNSIGREARYWYGTLGVDESSVLRSDVLDIDFVSIKESPCLVYDMDLWGGRYYVQLTNKTGDMLYIDLASTFRIDQDDDFRVYYDGTSTTVSNGRSGGIGVNAGAITGALGIVGVAGTLANGVTVGGSKSSGSSITYGVQRILTIPPYGKVALSQDKWADKHTKVSYDETFLILPRDNGIKVNDNVKIRVNEHQTYNNAQESPMSFKYIITFSQTPDFSIAQKMSATVFLKDVLGVKFSVMNGRPVAGVTWYIDGFGSAAKKFFENGVTEVKDNCIFVYGRTKE